MTTYYYNPWRLGVLTESITVAVTPIEKLDTSKEYVIVTNGLLTEHNDFEEKDTEFDWNAFHSKHHSYIDTEDVQLTDSIFLWAEGDKDKKTWKWCKYGRKKSSARDKDDAEFIKRIQHEGKVVVVTSVSTNIRRYFNDGTVEKNENNDWELQATAPTQLQDEPVPNLEDSVDIFEDFWVDDKD